MKPYAVILFALFLCCCSQPSFVNDYAPIQETTEVPKFFELPARFAVARTVYGRAQAASFKEEEIWDELILRTKGFGSFMPLTSVETNFRTSTNQGLVETARAQRFNYLLLVRMNPSVGSADIFLFDTASGGVMATAQAVSAEGGKRGFWGGPIRNPVRLDRHNLKIAKATVPVIEEMLLGVAERQQK